MKSVKYSTPVPKLEGLSNATQPFHLSFQPICIFAFDISPTILSAFPLLFASSLVSLWYVTILRYNSLKAQSVLSSFLNLPGYSALGGGGWGGKRGERKKRKSQIKRIKVWKTCWLGLSFIQGCLSRSKSCTTHLREVSSCSKGKTENMEKINAYTVSKITLYFEMWLRTWQVSCLVNISYN